MIILLTNVIAMHLLLKLFLAYNELHCFKSLMWQIMMFNERLVLPVIPLSSSHPYLLSSFTLFVPAFPFWFFFLDFFHDTSKFKT